MPVSSFPRPGAHFSRTVAIVSFKSRFVSSCWIVSCTLHVRSSSLLTDILPWSFCLGTRDCTLTYISFACYLLPSQDFLHCVHQVGVRDTRLLTYTLFHQVTLVFQVTLVLAPVYWGWGCLPGVGRKEYREAYSYVRESFSKVGLCFNGFTLPPKVLEIYI